MLQEMMGNQIGAGVGSVPDFITAHRDGKIRIVGVMGPRTPGLLPDVPTFAELGLKGFEELPTTASSRRLARRLPSSSASRQLWPRCWLIAPSTRA